VIEDSALTPAPARTRVFASRQSGAKHPGASALLLWSQRVTMIFRRQPVGIAAMRLSEPFACRVRYNAQFWLRSGFYATERCAARLPSVLQGFCCICVQVASAHDTAVCRCCNGLVDCNVPLDMSLTNRCGMKCQRLFDEAFATARAVSMFSHGDTGCAASPHDR
jgi:hypothetical protein